MAVVFRTTTDGTGTNTFRWNLTTGLVSSKATTWYAEDFAIAMGTEGTVGGFYGDRNGNSQQIWDRRPFRLHDGLPHCTTDFRMSPSWPSRRRRRCGS